MWLCSVKGSFCMRFSTYGCTIHLRWGAPKTHTNAIFTLPFCFLLSCSYIEVVYLQATIRKSTTCQKPNNLYTFINEPNTIQCTNNTHKWINAPTTNAFENQFCAYCLWGPNENGNVSFSIILRINSFVCFIIIIIIIMYFILVHMAYPMRIGITLRRSARRHSAADKRK